VTAQALNVAEWGAYSLRPRRADTPLLEHLVELPSDARETAWQALDVVRPGLAILRYGNYVGSSSLGGRALRVTSERLTPSEVDAMLDDIVTGLHSLPFYFDTPVQLGYARDVHASEDVGYQAYAFVAHALRSSGPHDLPTALGRILARPHVRLVPIVDDVPLARASRVDAETLFGLARTASPLHPIPTNSPLAVTPIAIALGKRAPENVRAGRLIESTDTPENRFIVAVLEAALDVIESFRQAVLRDYPARAERFLQEVAEFAAQLSRWRRHLALKDLPPLRRLSTESTVLRGRPGYREVTRFYVDLNARTRLLDQQDASVFSNHVMLRSSTNIGASSRSWTR
jgi:predicted component of viral defense system (DUF524 family)